MLQAYPEFCRATFDLAPANFLTICSELQREYGKVQCSAISELQKEHQQVQHCSAQSLQTRLDIGLLHFVDQ